MERINKNDILIIQKNSEHSYTAYIPELDTKLHDVDIFGALQAAFATIKAADNKSLEDAQRLIDIAAEMVALSKEREAIMERTNQKKLKALDLLDEEEQCLRLAGIMNEPNSSVQAVSWSPWRDLNGDGDMEHCWSWYGYKPLK